MIKFNEPNGGQVISFKNGSIMQKELRINRLKFLMTDQLFLKMFMSWQNNASIVRHHLY